VALTVVLDEAARAAVDSAIMQWEDAERAWLAMEWTLSHDPQVGVPLREGGNMRGFVYRGARSVGQPDVQVIYELTKHEIIVRDVVFSDAKASQAGHA
jgi:hypothetical protein